MSVAEPLNPIDVTVDVPVAKAPRNASRTG